MALRCASNAPQIFSNCSIVIARGGLPHTLTAAARTCSLEILLPMMTLPPRQQSGLWFGCQCSETHPDTDRDCNCPAERDPVTRDQPNFLRLTPRKFGAS